MAAEQIKSLELHYTMIQFLIIALIPDFHQCACPDEGLTLETSALESGP